MQGQKDQSSRNCCQNHILNHWKLLILKRQLFMIYYNRYSIRNHTTSKSINDSEFKYIDSQYNNQFKRNFSAKKKSLYMLPYLYSKLVVFLFYFLFNLLRSDIILVVIVVVVFSKCNTRRYVYIYII